MTSPNAEVAEEMAQATMLLFPTRVDNSPNAVKEAVVRGLPVVASAVGGIPDYVSPGQNGLLFPAGNLGEFTQSIRAARRTRCLAGARSSPKPANGCETTFHPKP